MNLLAVGATGRTVRRVLAETIARGHSATAITRRLGSLNQQDNLRILVGDPLKLKLLESALPGNDAVISCFGQQSKADA